MSAYHGKVATSTTTTSKKVETYYSVTKKTYYEDGIFDRPTVSVIIPTLNEAFNLPLVLPFLPMDWIDEVILVDGRSTDNTIEVALQLMPSIKIIEEKRKGKGVAMRAGYAAATSDIIVLLDADGSNDPREIPGFIKRLMQGADMVKGSRFSVGGGTTDMTLVRKLGNNFLAFVSNLLFSQKYTDLCYGFHAFWRYCLDVLELEKYDGFEIDTGLYLQALRKNLHIVEEPSFEGERFHGSSNLNAVRDGIRVLKTIFNERVAPYERVQHSAGFRGHKNSQSQKTPIKLPLLALGEPLFMMQFLVFWKGNSRSLLERTLRMALDSLDASFGTLVLLDEDGRISESCLVGETNLSNKSSSVSEDVLHNGLAGWVVKNRQPAIVSNTNEDPRWLQREYDNSDQKYTKSALSVPLIFGNHVLGVLTLTRPFEKQFTEKDLLSFQRVAVGI